MWTYEGSKRTKVVQCVQDDVKPPEPCNVELWLLDVAMYWRDLDVGVEGMCCFRGNLTASL